MSKHGMLAAVVWSVAAVFAVGSGLAAISAVGSGITELDVTPMTPGQVDAALAAPATPPNSPPTPAPSAPPAPSVPPAPAGSAAPTNPAAPAPRDSSRPAPSTTRRVTTGATNLASEAGDVVARCDRGDAFLVSWTPAQNYSAGASNRTPPGPVFVRFQSSTRLVTVTVTCRADRPYAAVSVDRRPKPSHRPMPGRG